jgi:hypothetical protein
MMLVGRKLLGVVSALRSIGTILGEPAAAPAQLPATAQPAAPVAGDPTPEGLPAQVATAGAQVAEQGGPGRLPEGIMTEEEMKAHEQLPRPTSYREQQQQEAEGERYIKSFDYYQGQR